MKRNILALAAAVPLLAGASTAQAWSDHTLGSIPAFQAMPEVAGSAPVQAESLERFLQSQHQGLVEILRQEEIWARQNVKDYPPRPDALQLGDDVAPADLRRRFLEAIRVNPQVKLPLFVQPLPGEDPEGRSALPWQEVTVLRHSVTQSKTPYLALQEGESVSVIDVVATASDEPDYGLDIGLFDDNNTAWGARYGFGKQPFGNPVLEYGSQAPFHMAFFHEAGIVYSLAGFIKRTWPEARIHMYQTLARYAFKSGHPYWGWRFTGWGLHYVQDLAQPYHSSLLPGISVARMLWINFLDIIGVDGPRTRAVQLVTNRHLALENYQYFGLLAELGGKSPARWVTALKAQETSSAPPTFSGDYVRKVLTREANSRAKSTDSILEKGVPPRLISDPGYIFEETEPDVNVWVLLEKADPALRAALEGRVGELLGSFGVHSRRYVQSIVTPAP